MSDKKVKKSLRRYENFGGCVGNQKNLLLRHKNRNNNALIV